MEQFTCGERDSSLGGNGVSYTVQPPASEPPLYEYPNTRTFYYPSSRFVATFTYNLMYKISFIRPKKLAADIIAGETFKANFKNFLSGEGYELASVYNGDKNGFNTGTTTKNVSFPS